MDIKKVIYNTTRCLFNLEDKLSIATIFLFCWKLNSKSFAELLHTKDPSGYIKRLSREYSRYDVDLSVKLNDKNVREAFYATREKVIETYDADGYFKALYDGDDFALVIDEIVNYNFDETGFIKLARKINEQLEFNF